MSKTFRNRGNSYKVFCEGPSKIIYCGGHRPLLYLPLKSGFDCIDAIQASVSCFPVSCSSTSSVRASIERSSTLLASVDRTVYGSTTTGKQRSICFRSFLFTVHSWLSCEKSTQVYALLGLFSISRVVPLCFINSLYVGGHLRPAIHVRCLISARRPFTLSIDARDDKTVTYINRFVTKLTFS